MAKSGEFYTFDEVVRQLKIDENKLKRLVSEGEISAFREGDVMKFKKSEIDKLAKKGAGSETSETVLSEITLEDEAPAFEESGETLTDDLVFEGAGDEVDLGKESGAKTEEISSQDTFIEEKGKRPAKGAGADVGMTTEPIDLSADLTQETEEEAEEVGAPARKAGPAAGRTRREAPPAPAGSPGVTFALVVTSVLLLLALIVTFAASRNELGSPPPGDLPVKISNLFYDTLGTKKKVERRTHDLVDPIVRSVTGKGAATGGAGGG
jgi:excisionase family DNA binding protein